ncbi:hypothetical protein BTM25_13980 [Actinomadura rubteroloni]|uniref:Phosphodiesterase n=1 Tax=Actinomadura rubteroloni TaxID=1926885 RepID=A0A2P4UPM1_9ACTN|nr:phosphodiesterase [Actinomadura rubteroloni]POM26990.1 hypothetical protein BTM25_13980 [Actinomadura rubteroloni]
MAGHTAVEETARLRHARALHPAGRMFGGTLHIDPDARHVLPAGSGPLAAVGEHGVIARLSKGGGLPDGLPDALGLALRVPTHGTPIDLLFTTSLLRHLPWPRRSFATGVFSTLMPYRLGGRIRLLGLFPLRGQRLPARIGDLDDAVRAERPLFALAATTVVGGWRPFARLRLHTPLDDDRTFDPVLNARPEAHLAGPLVRLRRRAYAASRRGRDAPEP